MRPTLLRILTRGLLAAAVLAAAGFGMAEVAGLYLARQPAVRGDADQAWAANITSGLRRRLPLGMAAWGFGLVAAFESLNWLVRGDRPAAPAPPRQES